jgi:hypothetical protein
LSFLAAKQPLLSHIYPPLSELPSLETANNPMFLANSSLLWWPFFACID